MSEELTQYIQTADALLAKIGEQASQIQCGIGTNGGNSASANIEKTQSLII